MHRVSNQEVQRVQSEYKKKYKPFKAFDPSDDHKRALSDGLCNILTTQNGQDTDDYCVEDNNKVERYLKYVPKGSKVLILGTGTGREVLVALDMGLDAYGTTFGSRNVEFGREYLSIPEDRLREELNEKLPWPKETFDIVTGFQVFEHTVAPLLFLLEQGRVLKNKGRLILEWPPANEQFSMGENPHHQVCFTPGQARALYQKAGFRDIQLYYDNMQPIPEEEMWKGDQKAMLVIEGTKYPSSQEYIRRAWNG